MQMSFRDISNLNFENIVYQMCIFNLKHKHQHIKPKPEFEYLSKKPEKLFAETNFLSLKKPGLDNHFPTVSLLLLQIAFYYRILTNVCICYLFIILYFLFSSSLKVNSRKRESEWRIARPF